ncbi:MAG: sodium:alanine symporter family protein [Candidatus Marinimicrobia bacterium]|nr:sodium:alanine symporter family protein [Candidatus Neomarinimicrobiota bacterium]
MNDIIEMIGNLVWGPHMLIFVVGVGVYFTVRLKFLQLRNFREALKQSSNTRRDKALKGSGKGDITPYEALSMALGGAVGNGNIAGVATAIAIGGPGAVFWMWISAFFGMAISFAESSLGVKYRKISENGSILAGPMYYMKYGLGWGWLAGIFAFFMGIKTLVSTSTIQTNSMSLVLNKLFEIPMLLSGLVIAFLTWLVIIKGIRSIVVIAAKLTPIMVLIYLVTGLLIVIINTSEILGILKEIVESAFSARSASGGFAGASVMMAVRYGVARGVYSNEAGTGSAPIVHGAAITTSPRSQGLVSMVGVFLDTLVINTITALVILSSADWTMGGTSTVLAAGSFESTLGITGAWVVAASSLLFGYSSLIAWPYYGEQCFAYLFGDKIRVPFRWTFCIFMLAGTFNEAEVIWAMGDILNGMMTIPNLIALIALGGVVVGMAKGQKEP